MQLLIDIPTDGEARVIEAFCTDRQQDGESEQDCILRLVSDYVNSVVSGYERNKAVERALAAETVTTLAAPASADLRQQVAQLETTAQLDTTAVTVEAPATPATPA